MDFILLAIVISIVFGKQTGNAQTAPSRDTMTQKPLFNFGPNLDRTLRSGSETTTIEFDMTFFGSRYKKLTISRDGVLSFGSQVRRLHETNWSKGVLYRDDQPFIAPCLHRGREPTPGNTYNGTVYYRPVFPTNRNNQDMIKNLNDYLKGAVINVPSSFQAKYMAVITWADVTDTSAEIIRTTPTAKTTTASKQTTTTAKPSAKTSTPIITTKASSATKSTAAAKSTTKSSGAASAQAKTSPSSKLTETATFQAVIVCDGDTTFVILNYLKLDLPRDKTYLAGFNGGYGRGWNDVIQCNGPCTRGNNPLKIQDLVEVQGSDYAGRFIFSIGQERIIRGGCLSNQIGEGVMETYPVRVDMFGGEKLRMQGICNTSKTATFYCKFGEGEASSITKGVMVNGMQGYCPVPILTRRGPVLVSRSNDRKNWTSSNYVSSVINSRMEPSVKIDASIKDGWTSRNASTITVKWTPRTFSLNSTARVKVRLIGYREDAEKNKFEFKSLEELGQADNAAGTLTFQVADHKCRRNCEDFEQGMLEVALGKDDQAEATDRVAVRFGPIPLGWYVNDQLTSDLGVDWSDKKCRAWNKEDRKDKSWLDRLLRCPCNLDQALADFGRWQPDPGCDLFAGSVCHYHKNAKHCVRSVVPTVDGSGNQCCYNYDGTLRYSGLSYQGSTPDRGHSWGAAPYDKPNLVPDFSHWHHDVVSFYYCCLWNEYRLCDLYMELRPTTDCSTYNVPSLGFIGGDPHVTTLDGQQYNFGGAGDFWLLKNPMVHVQGRFMETVGILDNGNNRPASSTVTRKATALVCLAVEGQGKIVQVCPAPSNSVRLTGGVDVRVGEDRTFFLSKSSLWQDFNDQAIFNSASGQDSNNHHDNFTILLTNNVGVKVTSANDLFYVTVAMPPAMKDIGGLLNGNTNASNGGFLSSSGTVIPSRSTARIIYEKFGLSWNVTAGESLFNSHYNMKGLNEFTPYFDASEIPRVRGSPSTDAISKICKGDADCQWDFRISGSQSVAMATKKEDDLFEYLTISAESEDNCGLPDVGRMAIVNSEDFSLGMTVNVSGCDNGKRFTGQEIFRCVRQNLSSSTQRTPKGGIRRKDQQGLDYVLHWEPEPSPVCFESQSEADNDDDDDRGLIIGVVTAVTIIVVIAILVIVVVLYRKRPKNPYVV